MILGDVVTIQNRTRTQDSEGIWTDTWSTFKSNVACSFQPATLNATELAAWGLTDLAANSKRVYVYRDSTILEGMRIIGPDGNYEIRGANHWRIHSVFLCIPVQG